MKPHKRLNCWQNSFALVKDLYVLTDSFPNSEKFGLTSQIRRAAVSVPVNIAEGSARKSNKEFLQFLYISLGSLTELDTLILLSKELGFINSKPCEDCILKLDNIGKLLYGLIRKLETKL
jgi:four helix bundle protein